MFAFSASVDPIYFVNDAGWLNLKAPLREQMYWRLPLQMLCAARLPGLVYKLRPQP